MVNFGESFQLLLETGQISAESLARKLGCSRSYIYQLKGKESIDYALLEKICKIFRISPLMFFDREVYKYGLAHDKEDQHPEYKDSAAVGQATMNIGLMNEVENLKAIIAEKERFIQFLLNGKEAAKGVSL